MSEKRAVPVRSFTSVKEQITVYSRSVQRFGVVGSSPAVTVGQPTVSLSVEGKGQVRTLPFR